MKSLEFPTETVDTWRRTAFITGIAAAALSVIGLLTDSTQFYQSYLFGYIFWINVSLGCLGVLLLHHLVSGRWGFSVQRFLEAGTMTIPLMAVLFLPIMAGMSKIYPWMQEAAKTGETVLELHGKENYLNLPFFTVRAAVYFIIWILLASLARQWSGRQDETADPSWTRKLKILSAPGVIVYVLTATFASIDWVMSLEPEWWSSIYGFIFVVGQCLAAFSLMIMLAARFSKEKPLSRIITSTQFHHLGNLLLAFVILWAYTAFSQYLIMWAGNLPEEIPWYLKRMSEGWKIFPLVLIIVHFFVPFLLLLSRQLKKASGTIATIAAGVFIIRFVDVYWLIMPALYPEGFHFHWLSLTIPAAIGGLWFGFFFNALKRRALVPQNDARFIVIPEQTHA
jgi:hypothetical protein